MMRNNLMETLGWIMFIFAFLCCWFIYRLFRRSITREGYLADFIIYLLLSDSVRSQHKRELERHIRDDRRDVAEIHLAMRLAIENIAMALGKGDPSNPMASSLLGADIIISRVQRGEPVA